MKKNKEKNSSNKKDNFKDQDLRGLFTKSAKKEETKDIILNSPIIKNLTILTPSKPIKEIVETTPQKALKLNKVEKVEIIESTKNNSTS